MRAARVAKWASLIALPLLVVATPGHAESLEEAVAQALTTSPDVLIDAARRLSVEQALNQAEGGFFPRADITQGRGRQRIENLTTEQTYGGSIGQIRYDRSLTLTQMLFDGFATQSEVDRNRARVSSAAHRVGATSEQIALRVVEAYLEVLRNQEIITLTRDNLTVHERTYDQIKLRAASGVGRKADQDQIEARLALARSNLTASEANLRVAEINYRLAVGSKPGTLTSPKTDPALIPPTADVALPVAFEKSRILKSAKADIDAAIAQHRAAHAALYPRLDLELSAARNSLVSPVDSQPDSNRSAMLRLRYNIFRGHADTARIAETKFLIQEAEEIARRTERQIEQSLRLSWNAYASAHERLPFLTKHAESSQLTRDAYAKQFGLGQRTLLDLLDTENEAFTATNNLLNGRYVDLFSRYRVLADMGVLLDTLGVPHPETAADPMPPPAAPPREPAAIAVVPEKLSVSASDYDKVFKVDLPPPEPIDPQLLTEAKIDPAAPAFARRPPSGAIILAVGRGGVPAESAARLRHRLAQLGFPVLPNLPEITKVATLAIGPYANDKAAMDDIERLAELGLAARREKAP